MTPKDFGHLRSIRWPAVGGTDYLGSLAEVGRAHYRGGNDAELFRIRAAEII
jgi:hypothetical protein